MSLGKFVRAFCGFVAREDALLAPIASSDVDPPTLHEVAGKPYAILLALKRTFGKTWIEQTEKPIERRLVAAVRGRSQQDQVTLGIGWQGA